jgi:hypothetical protein
LRREVDRDGRTESRVNWNGPDPHEVNSDEANVLLVNKINGATQNRVDGDGTDPRERRVDRPSENGCYDGRRNEP